MPLPFILGAAAAALAGVGVKKAMEASEDKEKAEKLNQSAKVVLDEAKAELDAARKNANEQIESLGQRKFEIYEQSVLPFVKTYQRIKNVQFKDNRITDSGLPHSKEELKSFCQSVIPIEQIVSNGLAALGGGGLAGLATYGAVGLLGTASTGTALGTLSGAALTNATLAWFGGGSLAAGGLGVAGGTMVLGGIVAGPALAIGGLMMASAAAEAMHNAYANLGQAQLYAEQFKTSRVAVDGLRKAFEEVAQVLGALNEKFRPMLKQLEAKVDANQDYATWSKQDQEALFIIFSMAQTLKNLMEVPLLDDSGALTPGARAVTSANVAQLADGKYKLDEAIAAETTKAEALARDAVKPKRGFADIIREKQTRLNDGSNIYCGLSLKDPKIRRKINNAITAYASDCYEDDVLVLIDTTLFGKSDEGFLITADDLYYAKNLDNTKLHIRLSDITRVRLDEEDQEITINGKFLSYSFSTMEKQMKTLAACFKEYIAERS